MLRILIFLLSTVFFAFAVTYLASLDNRIVGEAFGYKFDGPSGLIVGGLLFAFAAAIYLTHKIKDMLDIPRKLKARDAETRRARGVAALTRGLEAVAVGDAGDASHHAKVAQRNLGDMALTRLLTAQAAQLGGDEKAAQESFTAMLAAPETEFLGLRGLYLQAIKAGDARAARDFAERAFRLRGNAHWAFESVFALSLDRGAWGDAREALAQGRRNNLIETQKADRAAAALLTADAYAAAASDDRAGALREAQAALKLAPGLTPAAALLARLMSEDGKTQNAAKIIENAFAADPHPALVRIYDKLYADETPEKRAKKLQGLTEKNPNAREAQTLKARAHILLGEFSEAVAALEPFMGAAPTAFDIALMAQAAAGLSGAEAGRRWLERAAAAPRDPRPGTDGEFHFTRAGWARLIREYMEFGRLGPPPLEDPGGISAEEIRLLTAPPSPDAEEARDEAQDEAKAEEAPAKPKQTPAPASPAAAAKPADDARAEGDDHIHDDEEAARAAAAAREVS